MTGRHAVCEFTAWHLYFRSTQAMPKKPELVLILHAQHSNRRPGQGSGSGGAATNRYRPLRTWDFSQLLEEPRAADKVIQEGEPRHSQDPGPGPGPRAGPPGPGPAVPALAAAWQP